MEFSFFQPYLYKIIIGACAQIIKTFFYIIMYQNDESADHIEAKNNENTVWLNRNQIAIFIGTDVKTIGKHINILFKEAELVKEKIISKFTTTTKHRVIEEKIRTTLTEHYNLDLSISAGYRVKSKQVIHFVICPMNVIRDYLLKGYTLNQRMDRNANKYCNLNKGVKPISLQIITQEQPINAIFNYKSRFSWN